MRQGRDSQVNLMVMAALAVLMLGLFWFVQSQRQQQLRSSPAGLEGLKIWLTAEEQPVQAFAGGWMLDPETLGLLIIPLYDTDLDTSRKLPRDKEELLMQPDEYDLNAWAIIRKTEFVPSLVVLPKWRSGMRLTGLGHPFLRVDQAAVSETLTALTGAKVRLRYMPNAFTAFPHGDHKAQIYAAQVLTGEGCVPVVGTQEAMLLADCPVAGRDERMFILADPDLVNNHGLRLGDNAFVARDIVSGLADGRTTVIDYSRDVWFRTSIEPVGRERTWADLLRFFEPPFLALWLGAGLTFALALWRGSVRGGPVQGQDDPARASKLLAVEARARLMRLSGQDGALVRDYAKARIATVASQLFGPSHARTYSSPGPFIEYLGRRRPPQAARLADVLNAINDLPARTPAAQAVHHIDALEQVLEQITHDT